MWSKVKSSFCCNSNFVFFVAGFGMLTILVVCVRWFNLYGLIGAAAYISSGLVIGSDGNMNGIPRVDIMHYVLVVGNIFFKMALA